MTQNQFDETMSQDQAFTTDNSNANSFQFEEEKAPEAEVTTEATEEVTDSASTEDNNTVDSSQEDEQRVPYSRFKKLVDERDARESTIQKLEERLTDLETKRSETTNNADIEMPDEWVKLYGNSDVAKEAFKIQLKREEQIQERAVTTAIERLKSEQNENTKRLVENETIIDENLSTLSEQLGKKLSSKQEEDILGIVDEFSPVGEDGKYTSLFPFDKAYEIYTLRNGIKTQATSTARKVVADLSNDNSQGETESTPTFNRGWDSWQKEL